MAARRWRTPPRGKPWPEQVKAKAIELLGAGLDPVQTRDALAELCTPRGPSLNTVKGWARAAGVDVNAENVREAEEVEARRQTEAATAARLAKLQGRRQAMSEALLERLTSPSVELIADRLVEELEVRDYVQTARVGLEMALAEHRVAGEVLAELQTTPKAERDDGWKDQQATATEARKLARSSVQDARLALNAVLDARIPVRDLVGIATRALADHLALEGLDADEQADGGIVVELTMPEGESTTWDERAVSQSELGLTPEEALRQAAEADSA